jgi:enoyl-CoA hydratase/carnithine racemase
MGEALSTDLNDGVLWITIDRPHVRNALDSALFAELTGLVLGCRGDAKVRCVVIRGAGERVFVSGADISEFRDKLATPAGALAYDAEAERLNAAAGAIPQPVIAMLNGHAIGSGCLLAVACDFRIASSAARLGIPVAKFGFCIGPPDLVRLAALIGVAWAKRLLMTGALLDSQDALRLGLIDQVAAPEELVSQTAALARSLAENAPLSLKATKEMATRFLTPIPKVEDGAAWYHEAYGSRDLEEGIEALLTKRKPVFLGC